MMPINLRRPYVAGQFYPDDALELKSMIAAWLAPEVSKKNCLGCILPHAGYAYSGKVAADTVAQIEIKDSLVLFGPNHTGQGKDFSLMAQGTWQTPLGNIEIDRQLAELFLAKSKYLQKDCRAHAQEHSLEVQLPILQYFRQDFKIVPIIFSSVDLFELKQVAEELAAVVIAHDLKSSIMFIASSDLTHYEPQSSAEFKDALAIRAILDLDEQKLHQAVEESQISMCGFAPIAVLIMTAKLLGAKQGELIKYQTSGQTSGDRSSVVGYAGITIC